MSARRKTTVAVVFGGRRRQRRVRRGLYQRERRAALSQNLHHPRGGEGRLDGEVRGAGEEHAKDGDDHLDRTVEDQSDESRVFREDVERIQRAGEGLGSDEEVCVRDALAAARD